MSTLVRLWQDFSAQVTVKALYMSADPRKSLTGIEGAKEGVKSAPKPTT